MLVPPVTMTATAGYSTCSSMGDFSRLDGGSAPSLRSKAIVAEVAGMDLVQLVTSSFQMETTLAILYARAILIRCFSSWPQGTPLDQTMLGHHHLLLQLMKVLIFRGCQFSRLRLSNTAPCFATHATQVAVVRDILMSMLRDEGKQDNSGKLVIIPTVDAARSVYAWM